MEQPTVSSTLGREPAWHASIETTDGIKTTLSQRFVEKCIESGMCITLGDGENWASQASLQSYLRAIPTNKGVGHINGVGEFLVVARP